MYDLPLGTVIPLLIAAVTIGGEVVNIVKRKKERTIEEDIASMTTDIAVLQRDVGNHMNDYKEDLEKINSKLDKLDDYRVEDGKKLVVLVSGMEDIKKRMKK